MFILKSFLNIIKLIIDICFILVFVYFITFIPYVVGYKSMVVKEKAANTNLKDGMLVYYKKVDLKEIRINDIILYQPVKGQYVFHKVNNLVGEDIETNPDSYHSENPNIIKYSKIDGKVTPFGIPYAGYYVQFFNHNKMLLYLLIGIIGVDFVLSEFHFFDFFQSKK